MSKIQLVLFIERLGLSYYWFYEFGEAIVLLKTYTLHEHYPAHTNLERVAQRSNY